MTTYTTKTEKQHAKNGVTCYFENFQALAKKQKQQEDFQNILPKAMLAITMTQNLPLSTKDTENHKLNCAWQALEVTTNHPQFTRFGGNLFKSVC